MIHSVFVSTRSGDLVFAKYFDPELQHSLEERVRFESRLAQAVSHMPTSLREESVAQSKPQIATIEEIVVVYGSLGDVIVYVCGFDEDDEFSMLTFFVTFCNLIREACKKGQVTEAHFYDSKVHKKIMIMLSEMVNEGILETCDLNILRYMTKMNFETDSKKK
eukprot:TRINITY_DN8465_c0_g1_i2.p1 TRINITY_DN8465_c0_g1~~TRINITY_DN8465_c0_g1_i2.p1  ORF type:complete len:163 (+),score=46.22 TRINITY_DN8465_c0_g1_i2:50-538(+)